jgi:hypothetical protein
MAVFYDTGGGDIYGGSTKREVLRAMREDLGINDFNRIKHKIYKVSGTAIMLSSDHSTLTTLASEYDKSLGAYRVGSDNY